MSKLTCIPNQIFERPDLTPDEKWLYIYFRYQCGQSPDGVYICDLAILHESTGVAVPHLRILLFRTMKLIIADPTSQADIWHISLIEESEQVQ